MYIGECYYITAGILSSLTTSLVCEEVNYICVEQDMLCRGLKFMDLKMRLDVALRQWHSHTSQGIARALAQATGHLTKQNLQNTITGM